MEVTANYLSDSRFAAVARGHRVISDQPLSNNGTDEGMTPPEFLLASLATCAMYYAAQYLKTRELSREGLSVRVTAEKAKNPARLASFQIVVMTGPLDEHHRDGVVRAAKACLIHNTLLVAPSIDITVEAAEPCAA